MSKQVTFYLLPDDITLFEAELKAMEDVVFIAEPMYENKLLIVDTLLPQKNEWRSVSLARKDYLDRVYLKHIDTQNYWLIEDLKSEVIEFSRCYLDGNTLRRGRLYTITGYYNEVSEWKERDPEFIKWVDRIYRKFKKTFKRNQIPNYKDDYVSPTVIEWVKQGGQLSFM